MKTFEERYTAWVDGKMSPAELASFTKELASHPEAEAGKQEALALGKLLRTHGRAPKLTNPEFFTHQLLARIEAERQPGQRREPEASRPRFVWPLVHLGWAGVCSLLIAFILFQTLVKPPQTVQKPPDGVPLADLVTAPTPVPASSETGAGYSAEIVSASSPDPNISVTPVHSTNDKVTVLWMDGLDYLPASYHPH